MLFRLAGELCALPAGAVREILPVAELARTPGQPPVLAGFLNVRGNALPVLHLGRLFDLPPTAPGVSAHILVLKGAAPVGLLVDRVLEVIRPPEQDWLPLAHDTSFNQCAAAGLATPAGVAQLLSPERLLLEQERRRVAELQAQAQAYMGELEAQQG